MGPQMNETGRGGRRVEAEAGLMEGEGERKKVVLPRPCRSLSLSLLPRITAMTMTTAASPPPRKTRHASLRRGEERRGEERREEGPRIGGGRMEKGEENEETSTKRKVEWGKRCCERLKGAESERARRGSASLARSVSGHDPLPFSHSRRGDRSTMCEA